MVYNSSVLQPALTMPSQISNDSGASGAQLSEGNTSVIHMRLIFTLAHLLLVALGSLNLLVILVILLRPYMRSITNVYMLSLCFADFIYLTNLSLVAATQLNDKSWPFGSLLCTLYHGTETTGKYASVMFVVLLAADRYCAMCKATWCSRFRNYRTAICASLVAWLISIAAASPLYVYSEVVTFQLPAALVQQPTTPLSVRLPPRLCIAKWPSSTLARWYIAFSSVIIFVVPLVAIVYCYYHILSKLRDAVKRCKRMRRGPEHRGTYHRVTRLVLWVVVFHAACWTPFWLFNLFSSILSLRIETQFDRVVVNIIHLFPYINCALNPLLYVANAENFRIAFRTLFCPCMGTAGSAANSGEASEGWATSQRHKIVLSKNAEMRDRADTDSRMYPSVSPGSPFLSGSGAGASANAISGVTARIRSRASTSPGAAMRSRWNQHTGERREERVLSAVTASTSGVATMSGGGAANGDATDGTISSPSLGHRSFLIDSQTQLNGGFNYYNRTISSTSAGSSLLTGGPCTYQQCSPIPASEEEDECRWRSKSDGVVGGGRKIHAEKDEEPE